MSPESLLRKAQALGDDIKEMESIGVLGAYYQAQTKIKTNNPQLYHGGRAGKVPALCRLQREPGHEHHRCGPPHLRR